MKYIRDFDSEEFDENSVWDAVEELIYDDDLAEAMKDFSFLTIWNHLDEEFKLMVYDKARKIVKEERFVEIDKDEEDE